METAAVRILLVYGYEPSGHAAAASALEAAGREAGLLVSRVEVAGGHHPAAGQAVARGYHGLLRAAPGLWGGLYASDAVRALLRSVRRSYLSLGGAARLRAGVAREAPDVIVCPQASVSAVFAQARRSGALAVPVAGVMTDYGAHPFWADPAPDLIVAPTEDAASALNARGLPPSRVAVAGIPIHPAFAARPDRAEARRRLALPSAAPVILVSGGSKGLGAVDRAAAAVLGASPRATVLALCGVNDRLRRALSSRREAGGRLRVFGPQPPEMIAAFLAASDIHAGKPGGLTAAESLAAGVPMVLHRPLPGQEDQNARFLVSMGAAVRGGSPADVGRLCAFLADDRRRLAAMGRSAALAARPDAARRAIAAVLRFLAGASAASPRPAAPSAAPSAFGTAPRD